MKYIGIIELIISLFFKDMMQSFNFFNFIIKKSKYFKYKNKIYVLLLIYNSVFKIQF